MVLRAGAIVPREQLQRQEMTDTGDWHVQPGQDLEYLRRFRDLRLDSRRREENVEHDPRFVLAPWHEAGGGKPSGGFLLDERVDAVTSPLERVNGLLRIPIAADRDDEIDVTGEARFGPR